MSYNYDKVYEAGEDAGYIIGLNKALELIKNLDYPALELTNNPSFCNGFCSCIRKASEELEKLIQKEQEDD